jgi:hypothetical protein
MLRVPDSGMSTMSLRRTAVLMGSCLLVAAASAPAQPQPQQDFVAALRAMCGQAFAGRIVANTPEDPADPFAGKAMVMQVRECGEHVIRVPFHVGEDRSRTWVISVLADGLALAHDHRHEDGSPDVLTLYGGQTTTAGSATRQEFPADARTKELFIAEDRAVSVPNVWAIEIEPGKRYVYELARPGRLFRVEFDLSRPIDPPPPPWGAAP